MAARAKYQQKMATSKNIVNISSGKMAATIWHQRHLAAATSITAAPTSRGISGENNRHYIVSEQLKSKAKMSAGVAAAAT